MTPGPSCPVTRAPFHELNRCLACGGENLRQYFRAPDQPLANALGDADSTWSCYPLGLKVCLDCWHSQNLVSVDQDLMFRDYPYVSGTSSTLRDYFAKFAVRVESETTGLGGRPLRVLDIAANDGSLLHAFKIRDHEVLGVDPARNLIELSAKRGITVLPWYWEFVPEHRLGGKFDVVIAMNVLAHVPNPALFLRLAALSLKEGGRIYVQTSQANMVVNAEFDTCYHEHLSFFSASSFSALAERCGLTIVKFETVPIHGTSYLVQMVRAKVGRRYISFKDAEQRAGLNELAIYDEFADRADSRAQQVREIIQRYREKDYSIVGYGAAAKGITFLRYAGIKVDGFIDDNPLKQGKRAADGTPIWAAALSEGDSGTGPILWVITAWNFREEIVAKIKAARPNAGDAFLTYFPTVSIESPE